MTEPRSYYNEFDTYAAAWLRNLISAGHIAPGDVDERDIRDVRPDDLDGYVQCHFFAGIGGWSRALRLAGWSDSRPVWTGSCPCQPFSVAGKQAGFADPRHLWPEFRRLIAERCPATVFGEQVAGASDWLRLVRSDLEEMDYAVGAIPLEAASAAADHFRDRYWFVADSGSKRRQQISCGASDDEKEDGRERWDELQSYGDYIPSSDGQAQTLVCSMGHRDSGRGVAGQQAGPASRYGRPVEPADCEHNLRPMANGDGERSQVALCESSDIGPEREAVTGNRLLDVVYATGNKWGEGWTEPEFRGRGFTAAVASFDSRHQYIECPDGKWRRLPPPRVRWLGTRLPARVARLRAFGNSIDPRPAAQFIGSYLDIESDERAA